MRVSRYEMIQDCKIPVKKFTPPQIISLFDLIYHLFFFYILGKRVIMIAAFICLFQLCFTMFPFQTCYISKFMFIWKCQKCYWAISRRFFGKYIICFWIIIVHFGCKKFKAPLWFNIKEYPTRIQHYKRKKNATNLSIIHFKCVKKTDKCYLNFFSRCSYPNVRHYRYEIKRIYRYNGIFIQTFKHMMVV